MRPGHEKPVSSPIRITRGDGRIQAGFFFLYRVFVDLAVLHNHHESSLQDLRSV
jgi:hypothetical protein